MLWKGDKYSLGRLSKQSLSSSFEGYPLQVRHKQDWGRGFILLLPQAAALPGSDAGSDVIKPASSPNNGIRQIYLDGIFKITPSLYQDGQARP